MKLTLQIWRQPSAEADGNFEIYTVGGVSEDMSFLEMIDQLNRQIVLDGGEPVAFDHDCREGICGMCSMVINGEVHGPIKGTTTCQLHMRSFKDGAKIVIEPFRAKAFPVVKDLVVDRSSFDAIITAGGFITSRTGSAPDGNAILVPKEDSDQAMDAAACIGCGGCVAACPNAAAMLFTAAKVTHLGSLPQGQPERRSRALSMVQEMDSQGFGNCTNERECEAACPKEISVMTIAQMNRDYLRASIAGEDA